MGTNADKAFEAAIGLTLQHEGGYVNDPNDRGGETNWGITIATARNAGFTGQMKDLTKAEAIMIYKKNYWLDPKLDKLAEIVPELAAYLFDIGVNMGTITGIKMLQRAISLIKPTPTLVYDGVLGPKTLGWIEGLTANERKSLGKLVAYEHARRYLDLIAADNSQRKYINGWLSRVRF